MAVFIWIVLLESMTHLSGTQYGLRSGNVTMDEAADRCQLATPALHYTESGIRLNVTTDEFYPADGEKFWLGYVKVFQAFQYRGCVPKSDIVSFMTRSLQMDNETAPGDCASFCGTAKGDMIGLSPGSEGGKNSSSAAAAEASKHTGKPVPDVGKPSAPASVAGVPKQVGTPMPEAGKTVKATTTGWQTTSTPNPSPLIKSSESEKPKKAKKVKTPPLSEEEIKECELKAKQQTWPKLPRFDPQMDVADFEYLPSTNNPTDDIHSLCLAWNTRLTEYAWSECSAYHRYVCQQDESVNTSLSSRTYSSWSTIMRLCLKDGSEPASRKSQSDFVKKRWEPGTTLWIGEVRDQVITMDPDNSKAVAVQRGYMVLHKEVFHLGFGDDLEQHDVLCQEELTTPPTNPDSTETVTMYIVYVIIALVLAAIISVGVICVIRWKMRKKSHGGSTNQPENVNADRLDEHVGDSTPLAHTNKNRSSSRATNLEMGRMRLVELNDGVDDADYESLDNEPQQEGDGYEHAYSGLDRHRNDAGNEHTYAPMEVEPGPEGDSYVHMYSGPNRQRDEADNEHTYSPMQVEDEPDGDSYLHVIK